MAMNEKLKQSLDTRLGGMRWGEREQTEVFRQIQRKELQDVKHIKRGSGMLAIAIAMLFIVMGAAFALTNSIQPENEQTAGQTAEPTFVPILTSQYENEHFTLNIDQAACDGMQASFTATLRMKSPEQLMPSLDGHTPPGNAGRAILPVRFSGGVTTLLPGDVPMVCGELSEMDVLSMTADTTVFSLSGEVASLHEDATFTLRIDWTDPADGTPRSDTLTWRIDAPEQQGMLLQEFDLVTVLLADCSSEDGVACLTLDIIPTKPWYVLNRQEEGKASLTVSAESLLLYPTFDPQVMLSMVEYRRETAGEMPVTLTETPQGLRLSAEGPLPAADALYGYIVLHVYSDAAEAHYDEGFDDHYYEVCVPIVPLDPAAAATVTAPPQPADLSLTASPTVPPQPLLQRSEPQGEIVGGDEVVSIFLEDSWYDGFTADVTLRIRADDPANRLATAPNLSGMPDGNTWVVRCNIDGQYNQNNTLIDMSLEENTGDVIVHVDYKDLHASGYQQQVQRSMNLELPFTVVNERTWETFDAGLTLRLTPESEYAVQPLYLLRSSDEGLFLQGATLTSERYHYVGVMLPAASAHIPIAHLLDGQGRELAEGRYVSVTGNSLRLFPRTLFPYEGDTNSQFHLLVVRLDKNVALPEPMPIHLTKWTQAGYSDLGDLLLTTEEPAPEEVQTNAARDMLLDNPLLSAALLDLDFADGHAAGRMLIRLKDTVRYTLDPDAAAEGRTVLRLTPAVSAYCTGDSPNQYAGDFTILPGAGDDACEVVFYGYFPQWLEAEDPWFIFMLDAAAEDKSTRERYTVHFGFTNPGVIAQTRVQPVTDLQSEVFDFDSGLLLRTDYMTLLTVRWAGDANLGALYHGDTPVTPLPTLRHLRGEQTADAALHTKDFFLPDFDEAAVYSLSVFTGDQGGAVLCPLTLRAD